MKKFLAVLLSAVLCGAVAYSAIAEEVDADADVPAVVATEDQKSVEDVVADLANDEKAQEIADQIIEAVKTGSTEDDVKSLLGALGQYVNKAGFDVSDLAESGTVRDVLDAFLADSGLDTEELNNAISESVIADVALDWYYATPATTTTTTTEESEEFIEEPTTIPDTGDIF